jgi:putative addiction module antidote
MRLKLRAVGKSIALVLPQEVLRRLHVKRNDYLVLVEVPDGYLLAPYDPEVSKQVKLGLEFIKQYNETLRALSK